MSVASTTRRFVLLEKFTASLGLLGLAIITLWHPGTSRMYAFPGEWVYAVALLAPVLGCCWHFLGLATWTPPARSWLLFVGLLSASVLVSALLSPYRGSVLWWSAPWLSGVALFLWGHSVLQQSPGAVVREKLQTALATIGAGCALTSLGWWFLDLIPHLNRGFAWRDALNVRNDYPLGHANYTAGLMVLALPWLLRASLRSVGGRRILWGLSLLAALATLFTSGSRGGLIGLAVWVGLELLTRQLPWRRLLVIGVVAAVLGGAFALSQPRIRSFLTPADPAAEPNISTVQRTAMARAAVQMGADRPLIGWGLHATPLVYPQYRRHLDGGAENVLQVHSAPLELWAGLGALGLIAVGGLSGLALRAWRLAPSAATMLGGYGAFALTDHQLDVPVIVTFVVGALVLLAPTTTAPPVSEPRRVRWGLPLGLLAGTAVVGLGGSRDTTPALNVTALQAAVAAQPEVAREKLRQSLALNPHQEIAHFNLGWLLLIESPEMAELHFAAAARLVPDKGGVYFGLGLARLNQGRAEDAAEAFAFECLNDPRFMYSPWWTLEGINELRIATKTRLLGLLVETKTRLPEEDLWRHHQAEAVGFHLDQLGDVPNRAERSYRRERTAYPVLMRNLNLPPPVDLYDVREPADYRGIAGPPLPPKGWVPGPLILSLLDAATDSPQ